MNLTTLVALPDQNRTWATIDLSAIADNARFLQQRIVPTGDLMAVVKANAYGHGAIPVCRACVRAGVRYFGVAAVEEALELRRAGISAEIALLAPFLPEEAESVARLDLIPFVSSREQYEALREAGRNAPFPVRFVLTVDTGMGREGCSPAEATELVANAIRPSATAPRLVGLSTHFASADEADGLAITAQQTAEFFQFLRQLPEGLSPDSDDGRGNRGLFLSLSNSPASLRFTLPPLPRGIDRYLYRPGLLIYGIEPYPNAFSQTNTALRPALSWRARVTLVKNLPEGSTVGYGRTHTLTRPARIATIAVGYADGLSRRLSNRGTVLIGGNRFPIVGRVSMDQCQIDVTDAPEPVVVGRTATLIGTDGQESLTIAEMADRIGTTQHEPSCALSRRVRRLYENAGPSAALPSPPSRDRNP